MIRSRSIRSSPAHAAPFEGFSSARRQLMLLAQALQFGEVRDLHVRQGEPLTSPPPRVIRRVKIGAQRAPRPPLDSNGANVKQEWAEFFAELDSLKDGVIVLLEIAHGLPFIYEIEQPASL